MTKYADRPKVMAIGDSMYQGVRSLSFTSQLGRCSPPAQVADKKQWPMTLPNPKLPILFDLEAILRQGEIVHLLATIRDSCLANMQFWLGGDAWSQHEAFDNVAIGGAVIKSVYTDTYAAYWPKIKDLVDRIKRNAVPDATAIGQLQYALNVSFTLNPLRRDEQASKTQLDQVADREPEVLLVNIGSNEGLFAAAFVGAFDDGTLDSVRRIPDKMAPLAERLAALPPAVETIIFNSLVRPRTASNLMPSPDPTTHPGDNYFPNYVTRIGNTLKEISGATLKAFDDLILNVNDEVKALMQQRVGARLKFVDLYDASTRFDGKHYSDRFLAVHPGGVLHQLRNVPIASLLGQLLGGGLTGLDNMHPTVPGYALIADAVVAALGTADDPIYKEAAFANDSLLNNLPWLLTVSQLELAALGSSGVFSMPVQVES